MQDIFELHILPMDVALEMMHTNGYGVWVMDAWNIMGEDKVL